MRLFLSVLLVTLALCCYEANADVCPTLVKDYSIFLLGGKGIYNLALQKYNPPPENIQASLQVKKCTDVIDLKKRMNLETILERIMNKCKS